MSFNSLIEYLRYLNPSLNVQQELNFVDFFAALLFNSIDRFWRRRFSVFLLLVLPCALLTVCVCMRGMCSFLFLSSANLFMTLETYGFEVKTGDAVEWETKWGQNAAYRLVSVHCNPRWDYNYNSNNLFNTFLWEMEGGGL